MRIVLFLFKNKKIIINIYICVENDIPIKLLKTIIKIFCIIKRNIYLKKLNISAKKIKKCFNLQETPEISIIYNIYKNNIIWSNDHISILTI